MLKLAQPPDIPAPPDAATLTFTVTLAELAVFYEAGRADERAARAGT